LADPCPGPCNAAWRANSDGDPRLGDPVWCRTDTARIRRSLAELDELPALQALFADGHHAQTRDPARGGDPPSPSPAADDALELLKMLTGWEDAYRDWHNTEHPAYPWLTRPRRGVLATELTSTVAWLNWHLDGILASPLAADFGAEILQWHREFKNKTRAGTGMHLGLVPCAHCKLRLLAWADGDDHLRCGNCGRWMSMDDYHAELAGAARQLEDAP
jgi:hypothetical protein